MTQTTATDPLQGIKRRAPIGLGERRTAVQDLGHRRPGRGARRAGGLDRSRPRLCRPGPRTHSTGEPPCLIRPPGTCATHTPTRTCSAVTGRCC
ncbi:MAG: hypothetical protein MZV65_31805 [Chromatiales bacterium]|nr:hypothetical protein [Chromatiales bacterium]